MRWVGWREELMGLGRADLVPVFSFGENDVSERKSGLGWQLIRGRNTRYTINCKHRFGLSYSMFELTYLGEQSKQQRNDRVQDSEKVPEIIRLHIAAVSRARVSPLVIDIRVGALMQTTAIHLTSIIGSSIVSAARLLLGIGADWVHRSDNLGLMPFRHPIVSVGE